jgi:hypothetical protein
MFNMNKTELYAFRLDPDMLAALKAVQHDAGIPVAEQIRRGIRLYLDQLESNTKAAKRGKRRAS